MFPMSTERLFVAIALPSVVHDALAALTTPLPGVTWTQPEKLHLTLRFLGDVAAEKIDPVSARLATVQVEPFILPVAGLGTFPPKKPPCVIWCGIGRGHPRFYQLRQRLDDALLGAGLDFDVRTFAPHITLARCTEEAAEPVGHWLHRHREFEAPPFRISNFDLYASERQPAGAVHTLKRRFEL